MDESNRWQDKPGPSVRLPDGRQLPMHQHRSVLIPFKSSAEEGLVPLNDVLGAAERRGLVPADIHALVVAAVRCGEVRFEIGSHDKFTIYGTDHEGRFKWLSLDLRGLSATGPVELPIPVAINREDFSSTYLSSRVEVWLNCIVSLNGR